MNQTLMFIQADMHRAINDGQSSLVVSVADLKELLGAVESARTREKNEKFGVVFGFVRKETLKQMRSGNLLYLTIRRKKKDDYCEPVYCDPQSAKVIDVVAETVQTAPTGD